jgi:hypothetical protein
MFPWPFGEFDYVMDDALNIAMDYLIRTDQATDFRAAQTVAATAIATAWRAEIRSRLRLTNIAIKAVEQKNACPKKRLEVNQELGVTLPTLGSFIDGPSVSMGSLPTRSYSAITCAPTSRTKAPISTLNSTAIAVVSEPYTNWI